MAKAKFQIVQGTAKVLPKYNLTMIISDPSDADTKISVTFENVDRESLLTAKFPTKALLETLEEAIAEDGE